MAVNSEHYRRNSINGRQYYKRFQRGFENGVYKRAFTALNEERVKDAATSVLSLDSICIKSGSDSIGTP